MCSRLGREECLSFRGMSCGKLQKDNRARDLYNGSTWEDQLRLPFLHASNPAGLMSFSIGSTTEVDFQNCFPWSQKTILCGVPPLALDPKVWATQKLFAKEKNAG